MTGRGARRLLQIGVVIAIAAIAPTGSAVAAEPAPSVQPLLDRPEITLPDRSRIFDSVDLTGGCGAPPQRRRIDVDGDPRDWRGQATMISGSSRHDAGEWIWTDYAFDDDGTGGLEYPGQGEALLTKPGTAGKASARNQRYGSNAADVVELRTTADSKFVYVLARLNFLNALDSTAVGLALDLDRDTTTGFADWPGGAQMRTPGTELFLTLHGDCGRVTDTVGEQTLAEVGGAIRTSTRENAMEVAIPRTLLGGADRIDLAGGAGLWDSKAGRWMVPATGASGRNGNQTDRPAGAASGDDPAVFNLLFRGDEATLLEELPGQGIVGVGGTPRSFQTKNQNAALAGGTGGGYHARLDLTRLGGGARGDRQLLRRGNEVDFTRVYRSRVDSEGVVVTGNFAIFLGRWQPYAIHIPRCYDDRTCPWPGDRAPFVLAAHGGSGSHLDNGPQEPAAEGGSSLYGLKGLYDGVDAGIGPISVRVLARGQRQPWYRGLGEIDPLEVVDAVERRYKIDAERKLVTGGSLGGYAALRLASLYPDVFTGAITHCSSGQENSTSARVTGNFVPEREPFVVDSVMAGLTNVPLRAAVGTADPLIPITTSHRLRDRALALGLDYRFTEYHAGGHCWDYSAAAAPWIPNHVPQYLELLREPRATRPTRVRYAIDPRTFLAAPEQIGVFDIRDLGLTYDGVYWLSGLGVRDDVVERAAAGGAGADVVAEIDVVNRTRPGWRTDALPCGQGSGVSPGPGGDPSITPKRPTPTSYRCVEQDHSGSPERVVTLTVGNLDRATLDLDAGGVAASKPFSLLARGDGTVTLSLVGVGKHASATGSCLRSQRKDTGGRRLILDLDLDTTTCELELSR